MKNVILIFLVVILNLNLLGQDKIVLKNGETIHCQIKLVKGNLIKYNDYRYIEDRLALTDTIQYYMYNNKFIINAKLPYDQKLKLKNELSLDQKKAVGQKNQSLMTNKDNALYIGIFRTFPIFVIDRRLVAGSYERVMNRYFTFNLDVEAGKYDYKEIKSSIRGTNENMTYKGFGITPEIRLYPLSFLEFAPRSLFFGTYYRHLFITREYNDYNNNFNLKTNEFIYGIGFDIGYKFGKNKFVLEPLIGYGFAQASDFYIIKDEHESLRFDEYVKDFLFQRFAINLGYRF